jgi:hypothetical protein
LKKEENGYINVAFDMIVDVDLMHMISTFDNFNVLMELVPQLYNVTAIYKATDAKFIGHAMIDYPWPLSDREMYLHATGTLDYVN